MDGQMKDDIIQVALQRFKEVQDAEGVNRLNAMSSVEFCAGNQWSDKDKKAREGRPCLTINKLNGPIKQIIGDQRQNNPSIKVRPVDSADDVKTAEVLTGIIRNIEYNSAAEAAYDDAFAQAVKGGWGYFRIVTEYSKEDGFEQDIKIKRVPNRFSVYLDPSVQEADGSDASFGFVVETLTKEEFEVAHPGKSIIEWEGGNGETEGDWFTSESVRVAEYFYKVPVKKNLVMLEGGRTVDAEELNLTMTPGYMEEGEYAITEQGPIKVTSKRTVETDKVMWCKMNGSELLEGPSEWVGKYIPIIPVYGDEENIEGRKLYYSAIHHAIDGQKVYNWMASTAVETVALAPKQPWLVTAEQIKGFEKYWNVADKTPLPYLPVNQTTMGFPQRQMAAIADSGAIAERQQASDDIKSTTGIFDASLGARSNETSGVAIQARQREGDVGTYLFIDNLTRALKYCGRQLVDIIPKVYDTHRVVRTLGIDGKEEFAEINKPVQDMGSLEHTIENDLSRGKYDVVVDVGPAYTTQRIEAASKMVEMMQGLPQAAPFMMDLIFKNMDWPGAEEIEQRMQAMLQSQQEPQQQEDPLKQQKDMLDVEGKQISNEKGKQDLQEGQADQMQQMVRIAQEVVLDALQRTGVVQ
jgi:hypothetical protein